MSTLPLEAALATHPGRMPDKQVNEDEGRHGAVPQGYLAVVCDGMGGHAGGKEAAILAVETIFARMAATPTLAPGQRPISSREQLRRAVEAANDAVHAMEPAEPGARPGATCVAVLFDGEGAHVAHVGDSRVYHVKAGLALQVTRDHSVVQELVSRGLLTPEQAAKHPKANEVTRALGVVPTVAVDLAIAPLAFEVGDAFVLASDGMTDVLGTDEILAVVGRGGDVAPLAEELVKRAVERSGHDNTTALVVRLGQASAPARETATTVVQTVVDTPLGALREPTTERPPAPRGTVPLEPLTPRNLQAAAVPPGRAAIPSAPTARPRGGSGAVIALAGAGVLVVVAVIVVVLATLTSRRGAHHGPAAPLVLGDAGPAVAGSASLDDDPLPAPAATHVPAPPLDDARDAGHGRRGPRPVPTPAPTPSPTSPPPLPPG